MYPDKTQCQLPIKNAHTLQNNGILSAISDADHVMVTDVLNKVRNSTIMKRVGKNKATTFYGFCHYHDTYVFQDIETCEYNNEDKQNFLYAYRMTAQEYHKKERLMSSFQKCVRDNPSILQNPVFIENYRLQELSRNDVKEMMNIFNDAFQTEKFDILYNYVYKFDRQYQFAVTTTYSPATSLNGETIVDIYSKNPQRLPFVFMSCLPGNECFYLIMSCLKVDYDKIKIYFDEVENLDETQLKCFLNRTLPAYSENIVLNPKLWDSWSPSAKREYEKIVSGMCGDFEKLLNRNLPFDSFEEFEIAFKSQLGIINMNKRIKYDLFLL